MFYLYQRLLGILAEKLLDMVNFNNLFGAFTHMYGQLAGPVHAAVQKVNTESFSTKYIKDKVLSLVRGQL